VTLFDTIRAAWAATDREGALDRAVEDAAANGARVRDLLDALSALLLEVRAAGADDATEESIYTVCDRLTGWCVRERWIHTTDNSRL